MGLRFPYFMSYAGWRGTLHKAGLRRETGLHIRGWNLGVRVCTGKYRAPEEITLIMTAGSNKDHNVKTLGTIREGESGPVWVPEDVPGRVPECVHGKYPVIAALPVGSYRNDPDPDEYMVATATGQWPSREPHFGVAHLRRADGAWTVLAATAWDRNMSQVEAVTHVVRLAGLDPRQGPDDGQSIWNPYAASREE